MLPRNKYRIGSPSALETAEFLQQHHYLRGMGNFGIRFGLYGELYGYWRLIGVVTFGQASKQILTHAFTAPVVHVLELNRLAIKISIPSPFRTNLASFLVSGALRQMRRQGHACAIVSFADTAQNHIGTVYQASNFVYNGLSDGGKSEYWIGSQWVHERAFYNMGLTKPAGLGLRVRRTATKHRYWYFLGSHKQRRWYLDNLRNRPMPYPKHEKE